MRNLPAHQGQMRIRHLPDSSAVCRPDQGMPAEISAACSLLMSRSASLLKAGVFSCGSGAHGLEMTGTMLLTVARSDRTAPYVAVGGGLYRAGFDLGDARFLAGC